MDEMDRNWLQVPFRLRKLYIKYAHDAYLLTAADPDADEWTLQTEEVGPVLIKRGAKTLLGPVTTASRNLQSVIGGPNPLTSMLLGAALTGGLGYGAGWLLQRLAPKHFEEGLPNYTALAGALLGGLVPMATHGLPNWRNWGFNKGMTTASPLQGGPPYPGTTGQPHDWKPRIVGPTPPEPYKAPEPLTPMASSRFESALDRLADQFHVKTAYLDPTIYGESGGAYVDDVPTDKFGRTIIMDPYLPFPTRAVAAAVPIAAAGGGRLASPMGIARVMGPLVGNAAQGYVMGKGLGALGRAIGVLKPKAVDDLSKAGIIAGIIKTLGF